MKPKCNILLVEDDKNLGFVIKDSLEMAGYNVELSENGVTGYEAFLRATFDLAILDVMLPLKDGFTLAEEIRKKDYIIPIIFLTAKTMDEDKLTGFRAGGDDYVTKPFSLEELKMRIEAILKRTAISMMGVERATVFNIGIFTFNFENQVLTSPSGERRLTRKEAELLRFLCLNKNRILRRDLALKTIWGEDDYFMGRSMDVYITKLRKFLSEDPSVTIVNVHRTGFKLVVEETE
jgi:two-component system, OmpR family, response regulator VicR